MKRRKSTKKSSGPKMLMVGLAVLVVAGYAIAEEIAEEEDDPASLITLKLTVGTETKTAPATLTVEKNAALTFEATAVCQDATTGRPSDRPCSEARITTGGSFTFHGGPVASGYTMHLQRTKEPLRRGSVCPTADLMFETVATQNATATSSTVTFTVQNAPSTDIAVAYRVKHPNQTLVGKLWAESTSECIVVSAIEPKVTITKLETSRGIETGTDGKTNAGAEVTWVGNVKGTFDLKVGTAATGCAGATSVLNHALNYPTANQSKTSRFSAADLGSDGDKLLCVCLTDDFGESNCASATVFKDSTAPVVTIHSVTGSGGPVTGYDVITNHGAGITWSAADSVSTSGQFSVHVGSCKAANVIDSGTWTTDTQISTDVAASFLANEGGHQIAVCAKDELQNQGSKNVLICKDTTPPTAKCSDGSNPDNGFCPAQVLLATSCDGPTPFAKPSFSDVDDCPTDAATVSCTENGEPVDSGLTGLYEHEVKCTGTDSAGNTSSVYLKVTLREPVRVVFRSPLADDNMVNDIETDKDVANIFKAGSVVPHKVQVYGQCSLANLTSSIDLLGKVRLDITERKQSVCGSQLCSHLVNEVPEIANGVGGADGVMVLTEGHFHFNAKTTGFTPNTILSNDLFFRSRVQVHFNDITALAGEEDALLESKK